MVVTLFPDHKGNDDTDITFLRADSASCQFLLVETAEDPVWLQRDLIRCRDKVHAIQDAHGLYVSTVSHGWKAAPLLGCDKFAKTAVQCHIVHPFKVKGSHRRRRLMLNLPRDDKPPLGFRASAITSLFRNMRLSVCELIVAVARGFTIYSLMGHFACHLLRRT